jgi:hypothetical protein
MSAAIYGGASFWGCFDLEMPELTFETHGLWLDIEKAVRVVVEKAGRHFMGSIHALEHAAMPCSPCSRSATGGHRRHLHPPASPDQKGGGIHLRRRARRSGAGRAGISRSSRSCWLKVEELFRLRLRGGLPGLRVFAQVRLGQQAPGQGRRLLLTRALLGKVATWRRARMSPPP